MKIVLLAAAACLALFSSITDATDLAKIDRSIAREPRYQAKPAYCLLVVGPEARTRVWLVMDSDVLYVDRNGNGDLTEPGERIVKNYNWVTTVPAAGNGAAAAKLVVLANAYGPVVALKDNKDNYLEYAEVAFAEQREKAPVVHLQGPLSLTLGSESKLQRPNGLVHVCLQTKGLQTVTKFEVATVPKGLSPVAELDFPSKNASGPPIRLKVPLKTRRC